MKLCQTTKLRHYHDSIRYARHDFVCYSNIYVPMTRLVVKLGRCGDYSALFCVFDLQRGTPVFRFATNTCLSYWPRRNIEECQADPTMGSSSLLVALGYRNRKVRFCIVLATVYFEFTTYPSPGIHMKDLTRTGTLWRKVVCGSGGVWCSFNFRAYVHAKTKNDLYSPQNTFISQLIPIMIGELHKHRINVAYSVPYWL